MQPRHGRFEGGLTALAQRRESRRGFLLGSAKVAAGGALAAMFAGRAGGWAFAQGTPVASALASLGLPELKITATDTGYEGVPAETAAGWYLVTLSNTGQGPATADFMQLPQGMSIADFQALLKSIAGTPAAGTPAAAATAMAGGTPSAEAAGAPPPWYYQVYMAGGAAAAPGQTVQAVIELRPGDYAVWGEDPTVPQQPQGLKVTGTVSGAPPAPAADVTVDEVNTASGFAFRVQGAFKAGPQVVKVDNTSDQPHFILVIKSPVALTQAQAEQLAMEEPNATPPAGLNPNELQTVALAATQSAGATSWHVFDLEAGHYIIACFVTDPKTGKTHAMEGMIDVFDIGG